RAAHLKRRAAGFGQRPKRAAMAGRARHSAAPKRAGRASSECQRGPQPFRPPLAARSDEATWTPARDRTEKPGACAGDPRAGRRAEAPAHVGTASPGTPPRLREGFWRGVERIDDERPRGRGGEGTELRGLPRRPGPRFDGGRLRPRADGGRGATRSTRRACDPEDGGARPRGGERALGNYRGDSRRLVPR